MHSVVYGDILFLLDTSVDFLILLLVGCFLHLRRRVLRLLAAAALGGIYSVLSLLPNWHIAFSLTVNVGVAVLICLVAYAPLGKWDFCKLVLSFYAISVLLGGAIGALYSALVDFFGTAGLGSVTGNATRARYFLIYAAVSGILIFSVGRILSRRSSVQRVTVEIEEAGKKMSVEGIVDSGNLLRDPVSGKPVILVRRAHMERILPFGVCDAFSKNRQDKGTRALSDRAKRKMRVVLANGIGGGSVLVGYLPDNISLFLDEKQKTKKAVDALVAICDGVDEDFAGCGAIVPSVLWR
ncbi:MAG: sigma-E processing peptidase SpoIIGA [Clostridia bacterium]|nr:sigma-E processing peptidase SpoIIGA [Clostridia bacterium]